MSTRPDVQARHRRRRQATRQRILDATLELLQERPWHEIALEQIMARAQLTRTAFYKHFADRSGLLVACIEQLGVRLEDIPAAWERGAPDPAAALRSALDELVATYARHGRLLAAVADAAATDPGVRAAYLGLGDRLAAAAAERIAADVAAGRSRVADPAEVAGALVWMNEAYLDVRFGRGVEADPARAAAALAEVWIATVYGAPKEARSSSLD